MIPYRHFFEKDRPSRQKVRVLSYFPARRLFFEVSPTSFPFTFIFSNTDGKMLNLSNPLVSLSNELQGEIISFLPPVDALHLTETCQTLRQDLSLSSLNPPYTLTPIQEWSGEEETPRRGPRVPVLYTKRTHSITLKGRQWCGDGNCHLYVVAFDRNSPPIDFNNFSDGKVVVDSPIAYGKVSNFSISFRPDPSMIYSLWHKGEVVQTNRIMVHAVVYDNSRRSLAKGYRLSSNPVSPLRSMFAHIMWQALSVRG
jgi:hypothetical protein